MQNLRHTLMRILQNSGLSALPSPCALCGTEGESAICHPCYQQFTRSTSARCLRCAIELEHGHGAQHCGACLKSPPQFERTIVATTYAAPNDQLLIALKFLHQLALAPLLASALRDAALREIDLPMPELICPVPLSLQRLSERGFNQSLEIAKPFAAQLGVKLMPRLLLRTRHTLAQSSLHPDQRHKNIRRAFAVDSSAMDVVKDRHIGVVDDVMTTGTTLDEIADTLKRFGAKRVTNFVVARTPLH
jgi:ComF family protein